MADRADWYKGAGNVCPCGGGECRVADLRARFLARRNCDCTGVRAGDRVVIQTGGAGQMEALVLGRDLSGEILIRLSRWAEPFAVDPQSILRRLPREAA